MMSTSSATALAVVDGIAVQFKNGAIGLHDVSLKVCPGEVVALCGANGAGKTTTARAMSGVMRTEGTKITKGRVVVAGVDVTNKEPYEVSRLGVYLVPERRKVFGNLTVAENLSTLGGLPGRTARVERLERVFALFPDLRGRMNQAAGRLSGGQQQMLAIARGLMADARLLVIDEIALGLHPSLLKPLFAAIRQIVGEDRGAIIVHEDVRFSPTFADRYYVLASGRSVADGRTADYQAAGVGHS
jgi:branched-chain amino acid transport system ATP-binding protein